MKPSLSLTPRRCKLCGAPEGKPHAQSCMTREVVCPICRPYTPEEQHNGQLPPQGPYRA
jgi:hypothetical protein